MTLLSYEGVEVGLPVDLKGVQFVFSDGVLSIHCSNFSGDIVLSKPAGGAVQQSFPSRSVAGNKKRTIDLSASDDEEEEVDAKRQRPNFLSQSEQALLQAQLDSQKAFCESGNKAKKLKGQKDKEEDSPTTGKSTKKTAAKKGRKNSAKEAGDAIFSPEPKQANSRKKTPDSQKKRGRQGKPNAEPVPGKSVLDMMSGPSKPQQTAVVQWKVVETEGSSPAERWGHTATKISNNRMVMYGGTDDNENTLGDLHVLDMKTNHWTTPLNCETIMRTWHDAAFLPSKNLLLVFGGERNSSADGELEILSDIMVLDTECFLWYPPVTRGTPPSATSGHTCSVLGSDVVVFGGSRGRNRQSSVHVLDCDDWAWKNIKAEGTAPSARTYHSAVTVDDDKIVYFGGNDSNKSFDVVYVLQKLAKNGDTVWKWDQPTVVGVAPQARTGHSATLMQDGKILIFGGWDPQRDDTASVSNVFGDAFLLDTVSWEWQPATFMNCNSSATRGRVGHSAVLDNDGFVHVFGGQSGSEKRLKDVCTMEVSMKQEVEPEGEAQPATGDALMMGSLEGVSL